jgi:hypothetical protein
MPEYGRPQSGRKHARWALSLTLAISLILSGMPAALAGVGDINSVNNGHDVAGGTYYNTPGSNTTFTNSSGTGLYVKAGDTVTGREVDPTTKAETGNGGWLNFSAPGQVVRLDGNIDVSAVMKNGAFTGDGGRVTIESGALFQNGQIFANGNNAGMVQMNVTSMTMGPGARIEARGVDGAGGVVSINAKGDVNIPVGAVIDSSGSVIGTYNTNVIQVKGGIVNLDGVIQANGLNPGQQGGKVEVYATDSIHIGANGKILANGADGFTGFNPTNGGDGGVVSVTAAQNLDNDGLIAANGGNGGTNPDIAHGPVSDAVDADGNPLLNEDGSPFKQQASFGQDGGHGGNGGTVYVSFQKNMTNAGAIEVKGGNGGDGQQAVSDTEIDGPHEHIAFGGNGGDGGTGGYVEFRGLPSQDVIDHVNVAGGSGGQGGAAATLNNCGCATPGAGGACGAPGRIAMLPNLPPPPPPTPPLFPPYPKEYPRLGDTLPPGINQVLNYNRSIFLARAPLPIIQKRTPPPPVVVPPPAPVKPKPKPPQKKATVRGYW